ncbi:ETX/MTX2 family pore-forming toxin [Streptomyces violascens]|uniref:ETX/MTX2 family pore-forming toxin n=1 Tax=Streptomyces violascens TaxID=67381 RepID=UPI0036A5E4EC
MSWLDDTDLGYDVTVGKDKKSSSISGWGSVQHTITENEENSFKISDHAAVASAIKKWQGYGDGNSLAMSDRAATTSADYGYGEAFVSYHDPSIEAMYFANVIDDWYKKNGVLPVTTVLKVKDVQILDVDTKPDIIYTAHMRNDSSYTGTFHASLSKQVSDSISNSWSNANTVSGEVGVSIKAKAEFLGTGVENTYSAKIGYSHTWNHTETQTTTTTLGIAGGIDVTLKPGEAVDANLIASTGPLHARVIYEASLTGSVLMAYHNWALGRNDFYDVNGVLDYMGLPKTLQIVEDLTCVTYCDASYSLTDPKSKVKYVEYRPGKWAPESLAEPHLKG